MSMSMEVLEDWSRNASLMVKECYGGVGVDPVTLDAWQQEAMDSLTRPGLREGQTQVRRISMRACAGPGKSAVMAWAVWWFLLCRGRKSEHPKGVCLGASAENLRDNLWTEMHKWRQRSVVLRKLFDINASKAFSKEFPDTWWVSARSFPQRSTSDEIGRTLDGLHSEYCAVFLDESGGMPPIIMNRAEQAMNTARSYGLVIQAGNPLGRDGCLFAAESLADWQKIRITGDPDDPRRSTRVSLEGARRAIAEHGRDDAWVKAYILGEFPDGGLTGLISEAEVEAAMERVVPVDRMWEGRIGIDVARYGDDRTVLFPRRGRVAYKPVVMRSADGPAVAARYIAARERFQSLLDTIDDTGGYGGSVLDYAKLASAPLIGLQMAGKPTDARFLNVRAECYWNMAQWIRKGGSLPRVDGLKEELCAGSYKVNNQGKLQIEDKDMIKRRLGRSPDLADALALTFAHAERAVAVDGVDIRQTYRTEVVDDMDPLRRESGEPERWSERLGKGSGLGGI